MKRIGLIDCNNFFVSCERLFRPDLERVPVAVLSSNDGCVVARSQEVKDMGIPMGMPLFHIKQMKTSSSITFFSSNFSLYRDISQRVMQALKEEFDVCEQYSIDEAFFEVDTHHTEESLLNIRARIMKKTGIPVSIGVGSSKTQAKIASKNAKQGSGVYILEAELWKSLLDTIPCGSVWGMGRKTTTKLSELNIYTVGDFLACNRAYILGIFGVVGERMYMELQGVSVYPVGRSLNTEQESYTSTRSFPRVIQDKSMLLSALGHHTEVLAERLRKHSQLASEITVILRASRFSTFGHREGSIRVMLPIPTHDTSILIHEVSNILDSMYDAEVPYKKAGIIVSRLIDEDSVTPSLFENPVHTKSKVDDVRDMLNTRFGPQTVHSGVVYDTHVWSGAHTYISPKYTTKWTEIAKVKAI